MSKATNHRMVGDGMGALLQIFSSLTRLNERLGFTTIDIRTELDMILPYVVFGREWKLDWTHVDLQALFSLGLSDCKAAGAARKL